MADALMPQLVQLVLYTSQVGPLVAKVNYSSANPLHIVDMGIHWQQNKYNYVFQKSREITVEWRKISCLENKLNY